MTRVNLYECYDYDKKLIDDIIDKLFVDFPILNNLKSGSKVIIKANLVSAMDPSKNATTNPVLLECLSQKLIGKGYEVIIGDSPGVSFNKESLNNVYKKTRMDTTGALLNNNFNIKKALYSDAKVLKSFEYTAYLDEADVIINFCKLKTHAMMSMSCTVKNLFGTIPGGVKRQYHYRFPNSKDFANMLIDLNEYFKPTLNIVDAIIGMEGNGPTMGKSRKIGLILASKNPYALDYICSQIINLDYRDVETINQSIERNLFNIKDIKTNIDFNKYIIRDFKLKTGKEQIVFFNNKDLFSKIISFFCKRLFANRPDVVVKKCVGCGKCASICPAKAIKIINGKAVIDRKKCIKCYCCQEFCPLGAMRVKSTIQMFKKK